MVFFSYRSPDQEFASSSKDSNDGQEQVESSGSTADQVKDESQVSGLDDDSKPPKESDKKEPVDNESEKSDEQESDGDRSEDLMVEPRTYREKEKDPPDQALSYQRTIAGVFSPKGAAISPIGDELWVTSLMNERTAVYIFQLSDGEFLEGVTLPGGGAVEVIFDPEGDSAYVSQMETGRVFEIAFDDKEVVNTLDTGDSWTKVMALDPDGDNLWASNWTGNSVTQFSLSSHKRTGTISSVQTPRGLFMPDENTLYVAGFENGEIQRINTETAQSQVVHRSGGAMRHITGTEDGSVLYFSDMGKGEIIEYDRNKEEFSKFAETDTNPNTITLSPDEKMLFISCRGRNDPVSYYQPGPEWGTVQIRDISSGDLLDVIVGGDQPTALDISPDGKTLVFSNFLNDELQIYSVPKYAELKNMEGGRASTYRDDMLK